MDMFNDVESINRLKQMYDGIEIGTITEDGIHCFTGKDYSNDKEKDKTERK